MDVLSLPIILLCLVAVLIVGIYMLKSPFIGLLIMLVMIPGQELVNFLGSENRTLIWAIGIITAWVWVVKILGTNREKIHLALKPTILVILWIVWGMMSFFWAKEQTDIPMRLVTMINLVVFFILFQDIVKNERRFKITVFAYFIAAVIFGLVAIKVGTSEYLARIVVTEGQNPNVLALCFGIGLLLIPYIFGYSNRLFVKIGVVLGTIILVIAILMTGSRGAWVALGAAVVFAWLVGKGKVIQTRHIVIGILFLIAGIIFFNRCGVISDYIIRRIITFRNLQAPGVLGGRIDILRVGLEMVKENLIIGVGLDNFPVCFKSYIGSANMRGGYKIYSDWGPHNLFLSIQGELGVIGSIIILSFFWVIFKPLLHWRGDLRATIGILLFAFMIVFGIKGTIQYQKSFWLAISLVSVIPRIIQNEKN